MPRLLSDNGSCYISGQLHDFLEIVGMGHVRGAPAHPQTQGKIERYHRTIKNVVKLDNYYNPSQLKYRIKQFVLYYNFKRYHESLKNLAPADVYYGRSEEILKQRNEIKNFKFNIEIHDPEPLFTDQIVSNNLFDVSSIELDFNDFKSLKSTEKQLYKIILFVLLSKLKTQRREFSMQLIGDIIMEVMTFCKHQIQKSLRQLIIDKLQELLNYRTYKKGEFLFPDDNVILQSFLAFTF